jgi:hypothetical protein
MSTEKHTALPWHAKMEGFTDAGHWMETEIWSGWDTPEPHIVATLAARPAADANAKLVVRAVNSYEEMRAALTCWPLQQVLGMIEDSGDAAMWGMAKLFMEVRDAALKHE